MIYKIRKFVAEPKSYYAIFDEKTFDIKKDVDFLYEISGLDELVLAIQQEKKSLPHVEYEISSSFLYTDDSRKAHLANPVDIYIGATTSKYKSSFYRPSHQQISVTYNTEAIAMLTQHNYNKETLKIDLVDPKMFDTIFNEITEDRLKATIYHELAHWITDSLYNQNIQRSLASAQAKGKFPKKVDMMPMEIEGQIHGIKAVYDLYGKEWDTWSLTDLFLHYTALHAVFQLLNPKEQKEWTQTLIKRMNREGLLGKNMRIEDIFNYFKEI